MVIKWRYYRLCCYFLLVESSCDVKTVDTRRSSHRVMGICTSSGRLCPYIAQRVVLYDGSRSSAIRKCASAVGCIQDAVKMATQDAVKMATQEQVFRGIAQEVYKVSVEKGFSLSLLCCAGKCTYV